WMLGAALTLLLPDTAVPIVFIVLVQTLSGLSAYFLLHKLAAPRAPLLGGSCYVINADALLMTYVRSDFAEQLACALFPLVLLAALRLCGFLEDSLPTLSCVTLFAIPFAGVWLCNAPAGVIASYSMALLFAWAALAQRSWRVALRAMGGLALGLGLAGFYLLPAAYEQRWVNIGQALSSGLLPAENFLYTKIADPEHNLFNSIASTIAVLLMAMVGAAAIVAYRNASREEYAAEKRP